MSLKASDWAWANGDSQTDRMVLLHLADRADENGARCFPVAPSIAADCLINIRTVRRALSNLAGAGLITKQPQLKKGQMIGNIYRLHLDRGNPPRSKPQREGVTAEHGGGDSVPGWGCHRVTPRGATESHITTNEQSKNHHTNPEGPPAVVSGFDRFWGIYPKKVRRSMAERAYQTAISTTAAGIILAGLQRNLPHFAADQKYVPLAENWLKNERWTDEPPRVAKRPEPEPIPEDIRRWL